MLTTTFERYADTILLTEKWLKNEIKLRFAEIQHLQEY